MRTSGGCILANDSFACNDGPQTSFTAFQGRREPQGDAHGIVTGWTPDHQDDQRTHDSNIVLRSTQEHVPDLHNAAPITSDFGNPTLLPLAHAFRLVWRVLGPHS